MIIIEHNVYQRQTIHLPPVVIRKTFYMRLKSSLVTTSMRQLDEISYRKIITLENRSKIFVGKLFTDTKIKIKKNCYSINIPVFQLLRKKILISLKAHVIGNPIRSSFNSISNNDKHASHRCDVKFHKCTIKKK